MIKIRRRSSRSSDDTLDDLSRVGNAVQRRGRRRAILLAVPVTLLGVAAITAESPVLARSHSSAHAASLVKMRAAHILVNAKGRTLYVFAADSKNKSTCYGGCAGFWPPVTVPSGTTPPRTMSGIPGTFGVIMRTDGSHQLTYDGAPLYTFAGDKKKGQMNGQGLVASGGYWWAVVVAGK
ncbi:MAG TPA: hypothetical protein VFB58_14420 [Chloroflexota bacterium]|nr:hypothetical protein [Chloroflexota bacterium]